MSDFLEEALYHGWGTSAKQKAKEKTYNAEYYKNHKEKWSKSNRPLARQKNVTEGGTGVYRTGSVDPSYIYNRKEDLSANLEAKMNTQRELNNFLHLYNQGIKDRLEQSQALKISALKEFQHGHLFKAAKDLVSSELTKMVAKSEQKKYAETASKVKKYRVHNQHAIDEMARQNKGRKYEGYVTGPGFIPLRSK